ncbi:MAG: hypothetical protein IT236_06635 [Bacteroidia bacterium]|nr:hypothetical protein [Bacteroidia bacterium]
MASDNGNIGFKVVLPYMEIEVVAEDIVRFKLTKDTLITMEKSMEMVNICKNLFPDRAYKSLKIVHFKMTIDKDVMDFLASDARIGLIDLEAVVVNSATLKFLGNFYLKIKKPVIKTKIFDNEAEAMNWLQSQSNHTIKANYEINGYK